MQQVPVSIQNPGAKSVRHIRGLRRELCDKTQEGDNRGAEWQLFLPYYRDQKTELQNSPDKRGTKLCCPDLWKKVLK